jgi:hypothetical protein
MGEMFWIFSPIIVQINISVYVGSGDLSITKYHAKINRY